MDYFRSEVRAGETPVPMWMPPFLVSPPPTIPLVRHPGLIVLPEDRLRKIWFRRHPEAQKIQFRTIYVGEHRYWQHPATSFVHRQSRLIRKGIPEEEAYQIVEEEDLQEERYRDLERLLAIEQAEENGFDQLETARDLLIPPDFSLARERMLEELLEVLKFKGVPNVVPELLPKGMKWNDVLKFIKKRPQYTNFFNLDFLAAQALETQDYKIADALLWIYSGRSVIDEDPLSEPQVEKILSAAGPAENTDDADYSGGEEGSEYSEGEEGSEYSEGEEGADYNEGEEGADYNGGEEGSEHSEAEDAEGQEGGEQTIDEEEAAIEKIASQNEVLHAVDNFAHQFNQLHELHNEPSEWLFEDEEDEEKDEDEEVAEQEAAARRQNIDLEAEQFAKIMQRIERIYQPEQFPAKDRLWSDLVGILALRPKKPDGKLIHKYETLKKAASHAKESAASSSSSQQTLKKEDSPAH